MPLRFRNCADRKDSYNDWLDTTIVSLLAAHRWKSSKTISRPLEDATNWTLSQNAVTRIIKHACFSRIAYVRGYNIDTRIDKA